MRRMTFVALMLAALVIGWVLGKAVLGPSEVKQAQAAGFVNGAADDKSVAETAPPSDLEARADDAQEPQVESQDQQDQPVQYSRGGRSRNSGNAQRAFVSPKARAGTGIGIVTKPIKVVFRPLKRVNPLKLRLW